MSRRPAESERLADHTTEPVVSPPPTGPVDVARLERLEAQATSGPWETRHWSLGLTLTDQSGCGLLDASDGAVPVLERPADAEFIAAMRNAAPSLLAAYRAVERVRALCDEYHANCDPTSTQAQVAEFFRAALDGETNG